jgi:D-amino-acid dehydrogenase
VYAFGHQHLGWTLGGVTGSMVAQLVCGGEVSVEPSLSPFAPGRSFL